MNDRERYISKLKNFYIVLQKTIIRTYGVNMLPIQRQKLENIDFERDVVFELSNKPVSFSPIDKKLHISYDYYSEALKNELLETNPDFSLEKLIEKISSSEYVSTEELIAYSEELQYTVEDLIKSVSIQEVMKYIIDAKPKGLKEEIVYEGLIEYYAHELGEKLGIVVATPKELIASLELITSLKQNINIKVSDLVLDKKLEEIVNEISTSDQKSKFDEIREERIALDNKKEIEEVQKAIEDTAELRLGLDDLSILDLNGKQYLELDENGNRMIKEADNAQIHEAVESIIDSHLDDNLDEQIFEAVSSKEKVFHEINEIDTYQLPDNKLAELKIVEKSGGGPTVNIDENGYLIYLRGKNDKQLLTSTTNPDGSIEIKSAGESKMNVESNTEALRSQDTSSTNNTVNAEEEIYNIGNPTQISREESETYEMITDEKARNNEMCTQPIVRELKKAGFVSIIFTSLIIGATIGAGITFALMILPK